jgi:hypothetical protein
MHRTAARLFAALILLVLLALTGIDSSDWFAPRALARSTATDAIPSPAAAEPEDVALAPDVWMQATAEWPIFYLGDIIVRFPPSWRVKTLPSTGGTMGGEALYDQKSIRVTGQERTSLAAEAPPGVAEYRQAGYRVREITVKGVPAWEVAPPAFGPGLCKEIVVGLPDHWLQLRLNGGDVDSCQEQDEFALVLSSLQILAGAQTDGEDQSPYEPDSAAVLGMCYSRSAAVSYASQYCSTCNNSDGYCVSGGDGAHFIAHALCAGSFPIHWCASQDHGDARVTNIASQRSYVKGFSAVSSTSCGSLQNGDVVYIGKGTCWGWGGVVVSISGGKPYIATHSMENCGSYSYDLYYSYCGQPADYDCVHIDNSAPPIPTLNSISNSDGDGSYTVSWSSVSGATKYDLQERHNDGSWSTIYSGSNTQASRSSRSAGQWCYRVRSCHDCACSSYGSTRCTNVKPGTPTLYNISNADQNGSYTVDWSNVSGADSYTLQEQKNNGTWSTVYTGATSQASRTGRTPGQWCYRVRASAYGVAGAWSSTKCTSVKPGTPTLFDISNADQNGSYTVDWSNVSGADSYTLQEQQDGGAWSAVYTGPTSQADISGKEDGEWCYRVRASAFGVTGDWSSSQCTTVCTFPQSVIITGPASGLVDVSYEFTAAISPPVAAPPITYEWQATGQTPLIHEGSLSDTVAFTWSGDGAQLVTVTASNAEGSAYTTHTIVTAYPADAYESDDLCGGASGIATDGTVQQHTFHKLNDDDWVRFDAQANKSYLIRVANVGSRVDAVVMLYDTCEEAPLAVEDNAFGPTVQMAWDAPAAGTYSLHILQNDPAIYGHDTQYDLSINLDTQPPSAPRSLRAEPDDQTLIVQWRRSPEPDVTRYRIRWGVTSGGPYSGVDEIYGADNTYYRITGLANGTATYIVVTALDFSGNESPFSVEIGAIPAPSADATLPAVSITRPTANPTHATTVPYLSVGGSCSDAGANLGRVRVLNTTNGTEGWDDGLSGSGDIFTVDGIPLSFGDNLIQVTAYDTADNHATATLTVQRLPGLNGAVVLAGGHNNSRSYQSKIDYLTNRAYRTFHDAGFGPEEIFYLSPSPQDADGDGLSDVISPTTPANVHAALQWAADKVGPGVPFFLYLADHGYKEEFCADGCDDGSLWSDQLDAWLDELETSSGCDLVNVIIEACHSGSFIDQVQDAAQSLSQAGRVIVTATDRNHNAYASAQGAYFSDAFFSAAAESASLLGSFLYAKDVAELETHNQTPWLDDNGDGLSDPADGAVAANRYIASFFGGVLPRITSASVSLLNGTGTIRAAVERGGEPIDTVWAAIYAPSFQEPISTTLELGVPLVELQRDPEQEGSFTAFYDRFDEEGSYEVVIHAQDQAGNYARPSLVQTGMHVVYLPLVMRE